MSNLIKFAEHELDLLGMTEDSDDEMSRAMRKHILHMMTEFSKEGHSGFSASYAVSCLEKLMRFEPISPLTGEDDEWIDLSDYGSSYMKAQNKRCSRVFKREDGTAYDSEGIVFYEWVKHSDGSMYKSFFTCGESKVDIKFPYTPTTNYVEKTNN